MTAEPDYIVIRPGPDLPPGFMPAELDGMWLDRAQAPTIPRETADTQAAATAVPTGRFEVRDADGAVAEVYEVRPA